jgi:hypothetical protein
MTNVSMFQQRAEAAILAGRDSGDMAGVCEAARSLPPELAAGYSAMLATFGCEIEVKSSSSNRENDEGARIGACRLALLRMHFDQAVPRWSSFMVSRAVEAVSLAPRGHITDLLKAMWQMLPEDEPHLTPEKAHLIKAVTREMLSRRPSEAAIDLGWLLPLPGAVTEVQAYFAFIVMALSPRMYSSDVEGTIAAALKRIDFDDNIPKLS